MQFSAAGCLVRNAKSALVLFLLLHSVLLAGQTNFTLGTQSLTFGATAGEGSIVVRATSPWTASTSTPWLHIPPASRSGNANALFEFTYDENSGPVRTGNIDFNGGKAVVAVTQAGPSYSLTNEVTTLVSNTLSSPAVDPEGNVYFGDVFAGAVRKWNAANKDVTTPVSLGLRHPSSVAVDDAGNIYIADTGHNALKEWSAASGQLVTLVWFLNQPAAIALDALGDIYITDTGDNAIKKWTAATGAVTTVASSLNRPSGVAVDSVGNVYFSDTGNKAIKERVAATGRIITLISSGLNQPETLAVDPGGDLYFIDNGIYKWTAATRQVSLLARGGPGYSPYGLTIDRAGNLYVTWDNGYGCCFDGSAISRGLSAFDPLYSSPSFLYDLTLDTSGNVYFASTAPTNEEGTIQEWNAGTAQLTTPVVSRDGSPFSGVAIDPARNLYTADWLGAIERWAAGTGQPTLLAQTPTFGKNPPQTGMVIDPAGNLFFTENNNILEWAAATGEVSTALAGLNSPANLAMDAVANIYFFGNGDNLIQEWTPVTGQVSALLSGNDVPHGTAFDSGLAVDGSGDVYFSSGGSIEKWAAATGQISTLATPILIGGSFSKDGVLGASSLGVDQLDNAYAISYGDIKKITTAFVDATPVVEPLRSGSGQLPAVLPVGRPLDAVSDEPWLTITSQRNDIVRFAFSAAHAQRTAHISLLGQRIPVTQANMATPSVVSYSVLWGSQVYTLGDSSRNRLPWQVTGIRVVFSEAVATGNPASLSGVTATGLSGIGTNILTWTIDPISLGSYPLSLAASGPNVLKDAAGHSVTGDPKPTVKVLWGDVNDDGVVNAADLALTMTERQYSYSIFADLNGDGIVNTADVEIARQEIGHRLP